MQYYQDFVPSRTEHRTSADLRTGATARMLAAMAEPDLDRPGRPSFSAYAWQVRESDRAYFGRRSEEQRTAAANAASAEARGAHRELSALYAQLAAAPPVGWQPQPAPRRTTRVQRAAARRAERQEALLDAGLMETFPASDPVSVVLVN